MLKHALFLAALLTFASCEREERKHKFEDPFAILDRHITHSLAHHYLWPWSQLFRAASAFDVEDNLEEPVIKSDDKHYELNLNVKRFKPDELRIKVKNRYIIVEGKHKKTNEMQFMTNHFVQRFVLPAGSKQEEVTAILKENGYLTITVPKHEVPPPPPEREVPIEVLLPLQTTVKPVSKDQNQTETQPQGVTTEEATTKSATTEKSVMTEKSTEKTEKVASVATSSATPLEHLEMVEATTHVGKIRKKELKDTNKTTKDNEVSKVPVDGNSLDDIMETE